MTTAGNGQAHTGAMRLATVGEQRERLAMLVASLRHTRRGNDDRVREQARDTLQLAESLNDDAARAYALRQLGWCDLSAGQYEEALNHLHEAHRQFESLSEWASAAETMIGIGRARLGLNLYAQAIEAYQQSLAIGRRIDDTTTIALAHTALGNVHVDVGDYVPGLEHHFEALRLREAGGDGEAVGVIYLDIGFVYAQMREYATALDFFQRAMGLFRAGGNNYLQARALGNMSAVHLAHGQLDSALEYAMRTLVVQEGLGDAVGVAEGLISIATIHERGGRLSEAVEHLQKARSIASALCRPALLATTLLNLGTLSRRRGDFWNGIAELDRALVLVRELGDRRLEYQVHEALSRTFEDLGAPDKALEHFKMFARLREELQGDGKQKAVAELEVRVALEKAEREREIYRLQAEQLQKEVEMKSRELTAMALGIVQKNRMLDSLKERIARTVGGTSEKTLLKTVVDQIESARDVENDWKAFEEQFDQLHGAFMRTLAALHPELTPTELKICALLRTNLTTKDIANLLYLSERTVENHRYRLRKKMGLPADSNLAIHLAAL